ncbi:MAG: protein-glutamate O-methyltransferase CheR [Actinobacteria bacterium]|nr:protein-glutamate O-methyltransferase CheR [Actinomycetota bacterium]MCG2817691.1 protein-glutamate O-methyltransferase CheR [Actinomycetes bacterium]MBU4217483.1 protein-glutamate O-methyltransferase CheR [Actinomycetota bacterium]MBU4358188.1 protein-glutamate O-methyltransferase CheR [Actinomycetota bacterium]MBU4392758.1 protein-glutamate O-methyltransferase CheR [Actinomycetota bacterium]
MLSENQAFALLKRRVRIDRGLDCEQYKENYLKRRVAVRLRATGAADYLAYLRVLKNDPEEYTRLMNELTINVTQFFRDKDVYLKIRDEVMPTLFRAKEVIGSRTIRVWSAGCATGEEPYSLAMLIDHRLGAEEGRWNVRILGSDIDLESIRAARKGEYSKVDMLEDMDIKEYFETTETPRGRVYRVRERVRRTVKLEELNLLGDNQKRRFDLVLCRNVLIYFGRDVQRRIIEGISSEILHEGYLVLGKSETLGQEAGSLFNPAFPRERIYRHTAGSPERGAGGANG